MRSNIWNGSISFGLLNIPVSLQSAQKSVDLKFSLLDEKDNSHIKYLKVSAKTGKEVPSSRIVKGFKYENGDYIVLESKDFQKANPKATKTIDIEDFVLLSEIDTMMFDKPYYLVPQKGAEKGYFLLRKALENTKKVAVCKIVVRTKQHLALVMAMGDYLILEMIRFAHEIQALDKVDYLEEVDLKKANFSARELKMAEDLIKGMTAKWKPEKYKDTYYEDVMKVIEAKAKKGMGQEVEEPEREEKIKKSTNVIDLLPLLKKSLAGAHKKKTSTRRKTAAHARMH